MVNFILFFKKDEGKAEKVYNELLKIK